MRILRSLFLAPFVLLGSYAFGSAEIKQLEYDYPSAELKGTIYYQAAEEQEFVLKTFVNKDGITIGEFVPKYEETESKKNKKLSRSQQKKQKLKGQAHSPNSLPEEEMPWFTQRFTMVHVYKEDIDFEVQGVLQNIVYKTYSDEQ